jgi:hypothetical protein
MNRTTTVVVALIAAAGLSTMVCAVPEQRALAWGGFGGFGGCGFGCGGCGFGCGGEFFGDGFHNRIIQTIHQVNNCTGNDPQPYKENDQQPCNKDCTGNDQNQNKDNEDQNQKDKQTVCLNTAVNTARHGFGGIGFGLG